MQSINASAAKLDPDVVTRMVAVSSGPDAARVLRWLREQPKLVSMLAYTKDDELLADALRDLDLPPATQAGSVTTRRPYKIEMRATCETPLAHGAEGKAGNATLFRRIAALTSDGGMIELPYYAGNALRGQMRDLLADHYLETIGIPADRSQPVVSLWLFYALYSGGALEDKSAAMAALRKDIGDNGALRADGIRRFREMIPPLSLLGCALGNRVLNGRAQFGDLRPCCVEWGNGKLPVSELLTWEFLTRREDHEAHEEHHGMIADTEVLRTGAEMEGGIDYDTTMTEIERGCLGRGLQLLTERGMLGAENRRGLGRVRIECSGLPDAEIYDSWLRASSEEILAYLREINGLVDTDAVL